MKHSPRLWTVLSCSLLVASLGAGATACGSGDKNPLSARPYDAGDQVAFNQSAGSRPVDPDRPSKSPPRAAVAGSPTCWPWTPTAAAWRAN